MERDLYEPPFMKPLPCLLVVVVYIVSYFFQALILASPNPMPFCLYWYACLYIVPPNFILKQLIDMLTS